MMRHLNWMDREMDLIAEGLQWADPEEGVNQEIIVVSRD